MVLHHQPEIRNMHEAYGYKGSANASAQSPSDCCSEDMSRSSHLGSDESERTQATALSENSSLRTPQVRYELGESRQQEEYGQFFQEQSPRESPKSSLASTVQSDNQDDGEYEDEPVKYAAPPYAATPGAISAIATTPSEFSDLFPSHRRLLLRHDNSTQDGNMNLRVDTEVMTQGWRCDMTLFHLRMQDLTMREFSLRRYCRDSGREVCRSTLKRHQSSSDGRPGFQRSLSNAISGMKLRGESRSSIHDNPERNDSGYGSLDSVDLDDANRPQSADQDTISRPRVVINTIKLEFSNYAQLNVKRSGVRGAKRYEFEYWGVSYAWRRSSKQRSGSRDVSYHLTRGGSDETLGSIVPVPLTEERADEERRNGGWIPPCAMWINDHRIIHSQKDISDVVVSAGLIALVDDSIRTRLVSGKSNQLSTQTSELQLRDRVSASKRLLGDVFRRKSSVSSQNSHTSYSRRPSTASRPTTSGKGANAARQMED